MKKIITLLFLVILSQLSFSQDKVKGNGVIGTVETKVNPFKKIALFNEFEVTLIKSDAASVEIETDENLHEEIEISVVDSVLTVETSTKLRPKNKLEVTIFCTDHLDNIELNDDSSITSLSTINLAELEVNINDKSKANLILKTQNNFKLISKNKGKLQLKSNSKFNVITPRAALDLAESANTLMDIKTDTLSLSLKKNAFLEISGSTQLVDIVNQNNSDLRAKSFRAKAINLIVKDNSNCEVNAIDNITVEASDKSKIELYGDPKIELVKFRNTAKIFKKETKK